MNPYHDENGRFSSSDGCSRITFPEKRDDQDEREYVQMKYKMLGDARHRFESAHREAIENGAFVKAYVRPDEVRFGIVDSKHIQRSVVDGGSVAVDISTDTQPSDRYFAKPYNENYSVTVPSDATDYQRRAALEGFAKIRSELTEPNKCMLVEVSPETGDMTISIAIHTNDKMEAMSAAANSGAPIITVEPE